MNYFTAKQVFADLSDIMERIPEAAEAIFPKNLANACIRGHLDLNTPQNVHACKSILETAKYAPPHTGYVDTTFARIGEGSIAMAVSFTEYASKIQNSLHPEFLSKIGYSMLPGRTPSNCGWHLCMSKKTKKEDAVQQLFHWLCQRQISYYQTILSGSSTMLYPHTHHELLRLYPWLNLTGEGLSCSRDRIYPTRGKKQLIAPADFEGNMRMAFHKMQSGERSIPDALAECQSNILNQYF